MVQANECVQGSRESQDPPSGEVHEQSPGRVVLECNCRARMILTSHTAIPRSRSEHLECGVCGKKFVLARARDRRNHATARHLRTRTLENKHRYSWLEDYLERLEGKEARHEYYTPLEQAAPVGHEKRLRLLAPGDTRAHPEQDHSYTLAPMVILQ